MKKLVIVILALALAFSLLAGCAALDVVYTYSVSSLNQLLEQAPTLADRQGDYFTLSVDHETMLKISRDYQKTGAEDLVMQTPIKPFFDAGLDPALLGDDYRADADSLYLVADFGAGNGAQDSLVSALFESVKADRTVLTYHADLDHFGIQLPAGKIEWAKDELTNDKDIVFVIAAKPLADLGVDVQHVEGWVFKTMQDDAGKSFDVLLKPYSLDS